MKILQLIPNISGGGAERLVVDLSNQLAKDHEVILLTLYNARKDDLFRDQINSEIETVTLGKEVGFDFKVIRKLYKVIRDIDPSVIHNHLRTFNYLMPSIPFINDIPIIHTVHNDAYKECPNKGIRFLRRQFFKHKNIEPVTISKESANSFEKAYSGIGHSLIYNGRKYPDKSQNFNKVCSEISRFKINCDTRVFVNIGRQETQKNQLMLIKAFNRLVYKNNANAILLIIGGSRNNEASLKIQQELTKAEEEHEHIHILGERPNATDYLYVADFFCLSSLYEGMPITLIEAFATGTIPICTPVGGIPEIVSELDDSFLSESINEEDYYQTLKRSYDTPIDKQQRIKEKAVLLFKEKYSMEYCVDNYVELYRKLR